MNHIDYNTWNIIFSRPQTLCRCEAKKLTQAQIDKINNLLYNMATSRLYLIAILDSVRGEF